MVCEVKKSVAGNIMIILPLADCKDSNFIHKKY